MTSAEETLTELQAWLKERYEAVSFMATEATSEGALHYWNGRRDQVKEDLNRLETKRSGNG